MSKTMFFPYPLTHGTTISEWGQECLASTRDEAKFIAFLSFYGMDGVLLSDLIAFTTLRASVKSSENHWLLSGEVGPILRPFDDASLPSRCSFLDTFARETSNYHGIHSLEARLKSLGLIHVRYAKGHSSPTRHDWRLGDRVWRVAGNQMSSHLMVFEWNDLDGEGIIMDLLYVFLEMPSKDVSLLAERQRETYYNHARLFALEALRFNQTILRAARDYTVALILQLLTHRFQDGDERLLEFTKAWPSATNGCDWTIMVLWAEVKHITSSGQLRIHPGLHGRITKLLSWKGKQQRRANGLIGYLLVEWMKAAEASQDSTLKYQIAKYAMNWVETAWYSGSSIERAALCCVLAHFGILNRSALLPPKYHLLYGHYLSRAGYLKQAEEFLTLGCSFHAPLQLESQLWGYRFELVSVFIRLGDRQQAKAWLTDIEKDLESLPNMDRQNLYYWQQQEDAEARILSGLYKAELLMTAGEVSLVASQVEDTLRTLGSIDRRYRSSKRENAYLRSLRLALEMRLLEVRIWEGSLEGGLKAAQALVADYGNDSDIGPDTLEWIVQQLLTLSNKLAWAGNLLAALSLLEDIHYYTPKYHPSMKEDLLSYVEQRMAIVRNLLTISCAESDIATLSPKIDAVSDEPPERFDGPSDNNILLAKHAMLDFTDVVTRATRNDAKAVATSTPRNDLWGPMTMEPSGSKIDSKFNAPNPLSGRGLTKESKASDAATSGAAKKGPLTQPTAPSKTSRKGRFNKNLVQRGLRRSVPAMLLRAPRVPTTEPAIPIDESKETESDPVPV